MMGAEPGRPNELSPITRIDTARVRPVQSAAGRSFIEPGSPWQNPFVESFGSRVRDEVLSVEAFDSVLEAQTVITDWRTIYNHRRPHSCLGWRLPRPMPLLRSTMHYRPIPTLKCLRGPSRRPSGSLELNQVSVVSARLSRSPMVSGDLSSLGPIARVHRETGEVLSARTIDVSLAQEGASPR